MQFEYIDKSLDKIIQNPESIKVVKFFDNLEGKIGTENFTELIPVILTDKDPCFSIFCTF